MTHRQIGTAIALTAVTLISTRSFWKPSADPIAQAASPSSLSISHTDEPSDRSPEEYQGSFLYTSADEMLKALGITIYPEDKVYAFPEPALGLGSHLKVYRAQPVIIKDGTSELLARTWSSTFADLLTEQQIEIAEKDLVEPAITELIPVGALIPTIAITRVAESQITLTSPIKFATQTKDDPELEKGVAKTDQKGKDGILQKVYLIRKEDGVEVSRRLTSSKVTVEAVPEIIRRGTKVTTYGTGQASWYGGVPAMTAAHRTLPFGTKVRVINASNGKSVVVTIADRGPFVAGRIIDLSDDAFAAIASKGAGVASVKLEKEY